MIDIDEVRKLTPQDGDVFIFPVGTPQHQLEEFAHAMHVANPGVKCLATTQDIQQLGERQMNAAGWYRR